MRTRSWAVFIAINVAVSAVVVLVALFVRERVRTSDQSTPTPVLTSAPTRSTAEEIVGTPTAPPVILPVSPGPLYYVVREGDTLGAIAQTYDVSIEDLMAANGIIDPNVLRVGQTLTIPIESPVAPTAEALPGPFPTVALLPTPLPTLTPSGPPLVEIGQVLGSNDLAAEVVVVRNRGGVVSLDEWTLSDGEGNTFVFPAITLFTDAQVRVRSIAGDSTPTDLYWGRVTPAWSGGELITLRDEAGNVVDTYVVP